MQSPEQYEIEQQSKNALNALCDAARHEAQAVRRAHREQVVRTHVRWNPLFDGPAYLAEHGGRWHRLELVELSSCENDVSVFGAATRIGEPNSAGASNRWLIQCDERFRDGEEVEVVPLLVPIARARVEWLSAAARGEPHINRAPWNRKSVEILLGNRTPRRSRSVPLPDAFSATASEQLDESQMHALRFAAAGDAFIWGPPGTGKSRVLAWVAASHIMAGRSVLVAAPTNRAVRKLWESTRQILSKRLSLREGMDGDYGAIFWKRGETTRDSDHRVMLHGATLARCLLRPTFLARGLLDAVVVDEACQAMLPDILVAAACSTASVVLGGDPRQLGPVVTTRDRDAARTLCRTSFGSRHALGAGDSAASVLVALTETYRLPSPMVETLRPLSYREVDLCAAIAPRRRNLLRADIGAVTVVTPSIGKSEQDRQAFSTRALAWLLEEAGDQTDRPDAVVLAPTNGDADRLRGALRKAPTLQQRFAVQTIHGFQGSEASIVVVDALSWRPDSEFVNGGCLSGGAARMWTVALSRATHHVVLLAPRSLLKSPDRGWLSRYVRLAEEHGQVLSLDGASGCVTPIALDGICDDDSAPYGIEYSSV